MHPGTRTAVPPIQRPPGGSREQAPASQPPPYAHPLPVNRHTRAIGLLLLLSTPDARAGAGAAPQPADPEECMMRAPEAPECRQQFILMLRNQGEHAAAQALEGDAPPPPRAAMQLTVGLSAGYDSNYYRRNQLRHLTLTLPESTITLPLATDGTPRARHFQTLDLEATTPHTSLSLKTDRLPGDGLDNLQTSIGHARTASGGVLGLNLSTLDLDAHARTRRASTYWLAPLNERTHSMLELAWNHHGSSIGQSIGIGAGAARQLTPRTHLIGRIGYDAPLNDRPGGPHITGLVSLNYDTPRLSMATGCQLTRDMEGYSPLLENNKTRQQTYCYAQLKLIQPITPRTQLECGLATWTQQSDIELFEHRGHHLWAGIRHSM